jgi:hypothetical protein
MDTVDLRFLGVVAKSKIPLSVRFWLMVDRRSDTECWEWLSGKDTGGYGRFSHSGKGTKAHRFAWEDHFGESLGDRIVLHTCDNPLCCNPSHLKAGTYEENNKDRTQKGRTCRGENHHGWKKGAIRKTDGLFAASKLTPAKVEEIRSRLGTVSERKLAKEYGISPGAIANIRKGKSWKPKF